MNQNQFFGKVIFAGAGPGDPELLTLKAVRYLQNADVVIVDRLVSDHIVHDHVRPDALILHVGKQCSKGASTPQALINELLVEYSLQGKLVVRLKGGDVSVFSNILEELETLIQHNLPYEIIPGITAALGAAAYAGIPLTARNHSRSVRLLSFYQSDLFDQDYWEELAKTRDTLVFYMSSGNLDLIVEKLIALGIGQDKWISVIEQATTPEQRVVTTTIHDYAKNNTGSQWLSPTLVIIGKVAALQEQLQWLPNSLGKNEYFQPLAKNKKEEARA
jgi:uroporphyrin-III C-methyltransferase/precorrin-2 dehydrogenase/sirohydrochlorin ferrochelatase/uroporphyrin-III C-methyltransferase